MFENISIKTKDLFVTNVPEGSDLLFISEYIKKNKKNNIPSIYIVKDDKNLYRSIELLKYIIPNYNIMNAEP